MQPRAHRSASASGTLDVDDLARRYVPQRALLVTTPPSGAQWVHELKLDGYRAGAAIVDGEVRLVSRQGRDLTREFSELAAALAMVRAKNALVDGEIVVLDDEGRSDFQALQNRGNRASARRGLVFVAFDLLWRDGHDLTSLPLDERKRRLAKVMPKDRERVRALDHLDVEGAEVFRAACAMGVEGVVSKRRDAPYRAGKRSDEWRKSKCEARQEFVIGGFTDPTSPSRGLGSLLIGVRADDAASKKKKPTAPQGSHGSARSRAAPASATRFAASCARASSASSSARVRSSRAHPVGSDRMRIG
jgi:bifunctional non-homologous end joining protein LigD